MKLFLVRHGKSSAHEENRRQSPNSSLGQEGIKQAKNLAVRLKKEKVDILFSSRWERAKQTAEEVSTALNIPLELFDGIHEREHNPSVYGILYGSDFEKRFAKEFEENEKDLDWKFEGKGESIRDVIKRAQTFITHLEGKHLDQNLVVVTHEHFIRIFITSILLGNEYRDSDFIRIYKAISLKNTGISLLEYLPQKDKWELKYLNDHLHVEE